MPRFSPRNLRFRQLLSVLLLAVILPGVYFGGASAAYYYRQNEAIVSDSRTRLPLAPAPTRSTRLLVFAPHCDDEALGCAGLLQRTLQAGGQTQVVLFTNGDGFRAAAERQFREMRLQPADYIRFAELRQQESQNALSALGVRPENVRFLGYPDQGLMALWNTNWKQNRPLTSATTRCTRSPYANTVHPASLYCGEDVLNDVKTLLRANHPTLVNVTHPSDDHADHAAASAFVTRAVQELKEDPAERDWAGQMKLIYYIVHRGDWPLPPNTHTNVPLLPPTGMMNLDTRWTSLPLTEAQSLQKAESIRRYPSQMAMMQRFLTSFARSNEIFGELPEAIVRPVKASSMHVDGKTEDWNMITPFLISPPGDNLLRDLQGGGDLRALYAAHDGTHLYLRIDTRKTVSRRVLFTIRLRSFDKSGETTPEALTLRLTPGNPATLSAQGIHYALRGRMIELAVPWNNLMVQGKKVLPDTVGVAVETMLAGVEVDQSGIRLLKVLPVGTTSQPVPQVTIAPQSR